ncbi:hypothetical protein [Spongiibacter marinus]|uniref:hypothetical protein n=1 Tax=Spongiibacter marinus TaxID=354246 RepID=UPI00040042A8|nr:hypothetical protein [Spongiibacter marinus]
MSKDSEYKFGDSRIICFIHPHQGGEVNVKEKYIEYDTDAPISGEMKIFSDSLIKSMNDFVVEFFTNDLLSVGSKYRVFYVPDEDYDHGKAILVYGGKIKNSTFSTILSATKYFCQSIISQMSIDSDYGDKLPDDHRELLDVAISKFRSACAGKLIKDPFTVSFPADKSSNGIVFQGNFDEPLLAEKTTMTMEGLARPNGFLIESNVVSLTPLDDNKIPTDKPINFIIKRTDMIRQSNDAISQGKLLEFKGLQTIDTAKKKKKYHLTDLTLTDASFDLF